ncbi:VanW family protein [Patescibacteria group bacterium]|nr:VanW family protein [Patescibacteria group bacterium]
MKEELILLAALIPLFFSNNLTTQAKVLKSKEVILASRAISLSDRYDNKYVNTVFKDNILLALFYLRDRNVDSSHIDWKKIKRPFMYTLILKPNQTFAFHSNVLPQYKGRVNKTTNAHFNLQEGFKSDGYLTGDGVCHLASLMYWAAKSAGLKSYAPTPHSFAVIPDIPSKFGVSIYDSPAAGESSEVQNLYVTNNLTKNIGFVFDYNGEDLRVSVVEID